jgi:hypothetical protein
MGRQARIKRERKNTVEPSHFPEPVPVVEMEHAESPEGPWKPGPPPESWTGPMFGRVKGGKR